MAGTGSGVYETPPSLVRGLPFDSQELSAFFNQLIPSHNASSFASCVTTTKAKIFAPPTPGFICSEDPNRFSQPVNHSALSDVVADSSPSFDFPDPYAYVPAYVKEVPQSELFSRSFDHFVGISPENNSGVFICPVQKNAEVPELPSNPVPPPRSSSKRSRDAEFHNLSEKRRRSRINEKLKALQNLIPNSNKTDKASMLDEAIEYLKQLQLQVQILMMRNGLSLHPLSLPGGLQPMTLPQTGLNFDESNGLQDSNSANAETSARPGLSFPKHCSISNPSSMKNITSSDTSSSFQPSIKDAICGSMPQLLLDATKIGKPPCPDVS